MGPALFVYLCTVGDGGAAIFVVLTGSTGTCGGRVVWKGEDGL